MDTFTEEALWTTVTHLECVFLETLCQSVEISVVPTEHYPALSTKAFCVNDIVPDLTL